MSIHPSHLLPPQALPQQKFHCSRPTTGLLQIPLEIRREIYSYFVRTPPHSSYAIHSEDWAFVEKEDSSYGPINNLLLVSKQIYHEAADLLYSSTTFEFLLNANAGHFLKKRFDDNSQTRLRKLLLVARPPCCYYHVKGVTALDPMLWSPVLRQLTHITIVAQQPLHGRADRHAPQLEGDIAKWAKWVKPVMEYIGQQLQPDCVITVDDDNKQETRALLKESFPAAAARTAIGGSGAGGFRQGKTRAGDYCFERGPHIPDTRYWDNAFFWGTL